MSQPPPSDEEREFQEAKERVQRLKESGGGATSWNPFSGFTTELKKSQQETLSKLKSFDAELAKAAEEAQAAKQGGSTDKAKEAAARIAAATAGGSSSSRTGISAPVAELGFDDDSYLQRALMGLNNAFPLVGMFAAYETFSLAAKRKVRISVDIVTEGCLKGTKNFLPIGLGAMSYYVIEYSLRPLVWGVGQSIFGPGSKAGNAAKAAAEASAAAATEGAPAGARRAPIFTDDPYERSSFLSQCLAGTMTGAGVSSVLTALRWQGFNSVTGIAAVTAACAIGGVMLPDYEVMQAGSAGALR